IREAEISVLARNLPEALGSLRQVPRDEIPADLKETFRSLVVRVLTGTVRADIAGAQTDANLADLAALVATADELQELKRLRAELFVARSQFEQAFDAYLALADDAGTLVPRDDNPGVRVRSDLWVAGKLDDLRQPLSGPVKE